MCDILKTPCGLGDLQSIQEAEGWFLQRASPSVLSGGSPGDKSGAGRSFHFVEIAIGGVGGAGWWWWGGRRISSGQRSSDDWHGKLNNIRG